MSELTEHEKLRIANALFSEAWKFKEISEDYKERGLDGLAVSAWADGIYLMQIREKFREKELGLSSSTGEDLKKFKAVGLKRTPKDNAVALPKGKGD